MRRINKLAPLPNFNGNNYNGDCFYWGKQKRDIYFHGKYKDIYEKTRCKILIHEQNKLCGYTEIYINEPKKSHIDHYVKQEHNQHLKFDWDNYIVATKDDDFGARYKDNTYKIEKNEYSTIFNPISDDVETFFYYDEFGKIREDIGKIKKTIEVFNLNYKVLQERRKQLITLIQSYENTNLTKDDIKSFLQEYGFKSVVEQYCI